MQTFEYKVVPAPAKGVKARGVKTPEARFALGLEQVMNTLGADGWDYVRADTLPSVERSGLTGSTTNWRHVLVFKRAVNIAPEATETEQLSETAPAVAMASEAEPPEAEDQGSAPESAAEAEVSGEEPTLVDTSTPEPEDAPDVETSNEVTPDDEDRPGGLDGATKMLVDNGVEETSEVSGMTGSLEALAQSRKSGPKSDV